MLAPDTFSKGSGGDGHHPGGARLGGVLHRVRCRQHRRVHALLLLLMR